MNLKLTLKSVAALAMLGIIFSCSKQNKISDDAPDTAPVERFVKPLHVTGTALLNADNDTVVLTGPSFGWHATWQRFYNPGAVKALKEKWGANITRAAIGAHSSGDCVGNYDRDSTLAVNSAMTIIDAAIDNDMYVICDWHAHDNALAEAKEFFNVISEKYGNTPNILYEIWNEPTEIPWQEIKDYANELIPVIRRNAPDAVIIVGTPKWDQDVDLAAESPLEYPNLLYSLHYYAATHKDWNREKAQKAIDAGLPLIISESGSMEHTGDGEIDYESWYQWLDFADKNNLSLLMWDIADKNESCSMLTPDAPDNGMEWTDAHLKPWAHLAIKTIEARKK